MYFFIDDKMDMDYDKILSVDLEFVQMLSF